MIAKLETDLRTVEEVRVVGSPWDYVYDRSLFYDTSYHLTEEGAQRRTRRLAEQLGPLMQ